MRQTLIRSLTLVGLFLAVQVALPTSAEAGLFDPLVAPELKQAYVADRLAVPLKQLGLRIDALSVELTPSLNSPKLLVKIYADLAGLFTRGQLKSLEVEDVRFRATDPRGRSYWGNVGLVSALGPYTFVPCDEVMPSFRRMEVNNGCLPAAAGGPGVMLVFFRSSSLNPFDRPLYLKALDLNLRDYP